jgi:hypothetical protein
MKSPISVSDDAKTKFLQQERAVSTVNLIVSHTRNHKMYI